MITVDLLDPRTLSVSFSYCKDYVAQMSTIPGRDLVRPDDGKPYWTIPVSSLPALEKAFNHHDPELDELFFQTPKWKILNQAPPSMPRWIAEIPNHPIPGLKTPPLILEPYQVFGANFAVHTLAKYGFVGILDDVGLGKSPQVAMATNLMISLGYLSPSDQVLYVTLSPLKTQMVEDCIHEFTHEKAVAIIGDRKKRKKLYAQASECRYVVTSYELLLQDMDMAELKQMNFKVAWFDEPHKKVLDVDGKIHQAAKEIQAGIPWMGVTTATPLVNRADDIYSLLDVKGEAAKKFGTYSKFKKKHVKTVWDGFPKEVGYRGLTHVRSQVEHLFLRRTASEVEIKRPKAITGNLYVDMTPLQRDLAEKAREGRDQLVDRLARFHDLNSRGVSKVPTGYGFYSGWPMAQALETIDGQLQGLVAIEQAIADSPELLTLSQSDSIRKKWTPLVTNFESPKLDLLKARVKEHVAAGEKCIIFTQYKTMARLIWREIRPISDIAFCVGGMKDEDRDANIRKFKKDPSCMVFLGTNAASTGLNLQVARYGYNFDSPWTQVEDIQRMGRIVRRGSIYDEVYWYNLVLRGSIDERVLQAQKRKGNLAAALIGVSEETSRALKLVMNL